MRIPGLSFFFFFFKNPSNVFTDPDRKSVFTRVCTLSRGVPVSQGEDIRKTDRQKSARLLVLACCLISNCIEKVSAPPQWQFEFACCFCQ